MVNASSAIINKGALRAGPLVLFEKQLLPPNAKTWLLGEETLRKKRKNCMEVQDPTPHSTS